MNWLCRNLYRKEKGFTLVELMVVIIILAVLTGIAIPSYMALRNRARTAAAQSELKNIGTALEVYQSDEETYPAEADYPTVLEPDYMTVVPVNDPWDNPYDYVSDGETYTLSSGGPDGAVDGVDDIVIENGQLQGV